MTKSAMGFAWRLATKVILTLNSRCHDAGSYGCRWCRQALVVGLMAKSHPQTTGWAGCSTDIRTPKLGPLSGVHFGRVCMFASHGDLVWRQTGHLRRNTQW